MLLTLTLFLAFQSDWQKVIDLPTGSEIRIVKKNSPKAVEGILRRGQ